VPSRRSAARDEAASAGRGALLSRSGLVVLQYAVVAAARGAGRELLSTLVQWSARASVVTLIPEMAVAVETRSASVSVARFKTPATLANHRHDLAQDESSGQAAPANFRSGSSLGRRVARAARPATVVAQTPELNGPATGAAQHRFRRVGVQFVRFRPIAPSCPGRGAAHRALLRRAGTHERDVLDGPRISSAPHRTMLRIARGALAQQSGATPGYAVPVPAAPAFAPP